MWTQSLVIMIVVKYELIMCEYEMHMMKQTLD